MSEDFHPRSFLAGLGATEMEVLRQAGTPRAYRPRATLVHQGDPSSHVLLLHEGWVKITSTSRSGEEAILALRGPGDVLGEMAAIDDGPRSATVIALVAVRAIVVSGERFVECLAQHPPVALSLLRHISANLRESDSRRLEFVSASSSGRIAALLLKLAREHGRRHGDAIVIQLPLTQRELALTAATSREVVARTLRTLRERDIVRTERQRIVVLKPTVLKSLTRNVSSDT
ncbi:Crp/Fnr family transcriptional regulator [Virgisporangium aliadipatigenens]|uniref:Crp/Fnr family transcriptional regulator n=1 Tax=Virgisporangium aliadipatigenens TaxID=741659 RepID=A0A8J3YQY5_9ACTN|nr:Crp/Fnr family transcriptional regulator [Virgisporangium aliadipatigenens]GIJ48977.1 Crp/Fnr family transcriptional regulator [Virgisporangium aliadipatigenens]